ncbi:hypothetical protein KQ247_10455 [Ruegeria pomeroyi]|jgi:hypothetical protein|uniref:Lipoprotein n=2 Tax=Ruegeria pomeroyi TaxID=89184 RepID=V5UZ01_RUEPO|nr:hypothetical protein [Ruegeria pomeroyi]AHB86007.1 hypothetical protein SPO0360a [Ruegeria pomeroyi DSS-3]NVK98533.1 hypothetical protein [Ruegeria pomeroyi]NVK99852.1 hypothetical protein [Ruegeria pomeroyi]QWV07269.1 hypothetical protein KQ247_10455 [Ruegeria pomeroyi]
MKIKSLVLDAKRLSLLGALLAAGMVSACGSSPENEAKAAAFRACVADAGISGPFTTSLVRNSAGALSAKVEASGNVTQARADKANACIRAKGL